MVLPQGQAEFWEDPSATDVESHMAAVNAVERVLRRGSLETRPEEDADRVASVARKYRMSVMDIRAAATEIRDGSKRPALPLAIILFRVWGDQGAAVLDAVADLLGREQREKAAS